MRFIITEEDIEALRKLREADAPVPSGAGLFHAEVLGLVEGSYRSRKGLGTGGGKHRRYTMTDVGFAFMARLDWLEQRR